MPCKRYRDIVERINTNHQTFSSRVKTDIDGNKLNPIELKGVNGSDVKAIGAKLMEISEKARTHGQETIAFTQIKHRFFLSAKIE